MSRLPALAARKGRDCGAARVSLGGTDRQSSFEATRSRAETPLVGPSSRATCFDVRRVVRWGVRLMAAMKRLWRYWTRRLGSLVEDHPAGIPTFAVCAAFEETDCTLRGCYAVGHCRLLDDPDRTEALTSEALSAGVTSDHDGAPDQDVRIAGSDDQAFSCPQPSRPLDGPLQPGRIDWIVSYSPGSIVSATDSPWRRIAVHLPTCRDQMRCPRCSAT